MKSTAKHSYAPQKWFNCSYIVKLKESLLSYPLDSMMESILKWINSSLLRPFSTFKESLFLSVASKWCKIYMKSVIKSIIEPIEHK